MQTILGQMLAKYEINSPEDEKKAIKEVVQEVALCGLYRAGFFKKAAFYGGTALRIFYGLDRFSEDLDFSLIEPNPDFDIKKYFSILDKEMRAVGLNFSIEEKNKTADSNIKSAFLKGNTKEHIIIVYGGTSSTTFSSNDMIKIKFEVDVNPPPSATFENKYRLLPFPYQVKLYDMPSLFAGKLHAVICRSWKNRIKGRDLYDFVFYLSQNSEVNLEHLQARLLDSGYFKEDIKLNRDGLLEILESRFNQIDYEQAKLDVMPFIKDKSQLDFWCKEFFIDISRNIKIK